MPTMTRNCALCGAEFTRKLSPSALAKGHGLYCSASCSGKMKPHKTDRLSRKCLQCGQDFETLPCHVKKGGGKYCSESCRVAALRGKPLSHGHTWKNGRTPTYQVWANMKARCLIPTTPVYPRYGGRGIRICDRWLSYDNFLTDMGEVPKGMSIERIDNDGHYEPGNCRWATRRDQYRNRSTNVLVIKDGRSLILKDAADAAGISVRSFKKRMLKWPEDHWFDAPKHSKSSET